MKNKTTQANRKQRERLNLKRKNKREILKKQKISTGKNIAYQMLSAMSNMFPDFEDELREIEDYRRLSKYELAEIIMASIVMCLFKEGSRNAMNNDRTIDEFMNNYEKMFKMKLPHMDTVHAVFKRLDNKELEKIKDKMIEIMFKKKIFRKERFQDYYIIAIDGTGFQSFKKNNEYCLVKTSKNGKESYQVCVLEAKLVTFNGFAISIATEWIDKEHYDSFNNKQDCESKAFTRISKIIKKKYSHLKICIAADGLYPNDTFFTRCKKCHWKYIVTFKDGNLKSLWKDIYKLKEQEYITFLNEQEKKNCRISNREYTWFSNLKYRNHSLNYLECIEENINSKGDKKINTFVHLTNFPINKKTIAATSNAGRLRWKIENEGFNIQKNHGYALPHKYSRNSYNATKNYYQCIQIAHIINQITILNFRCKELLTGGMTIKHLWKYFIAVLLVGVIECEKVEIALNHRTLFKF